MQYYNHPNAKRQKEIDYCLQFNLDNPAISAIHNLMEIGTNLPECFDKHKKIITSIYERIKYSTCFEYMRTNLKVGDVAILCNNDIFLNMEENNPWNFIKQDFFEANSSQKVLNLSRHEYNLSGEVERTGNYSSYSSDGWVVQLPLLEIPDCAFHVGTLFADWAIAGRFRDAKYHVYNWADKYVIYHLDNVLNRKKRHPKRKKHTESNSTESARSRLFVCPYLDYDMFLKKNINPQSAKCTKRCKFEHVT